MSLEAGEWIFHGKSDWARDEDEEGKEVSISSTFYVQFFLYKRCFVSFFYVHVTREKLMKQHLYEKIVHKMLMKLNTGFCFPWGKYLFNLIPTVFSD